MVRNWFARPLGLPMASHDGMIRPSALTVLHKCDPVDEVVGLEARQWLWASGAFIRSSWNFCALGVRGI